MEQDSLKRVEDKLDTHIKKHDEDYRKLILWLASTIIGLVVSAVSMFVAYGQTVEKVNQLEIDNEEKVDRKELQSAISLIDNKFDNINEKLDDIKDGLNIK